MSKTYTVWIEIEEHDEETDQYTTLDAPGAGLQSFESYEQAEAFAFRLTDAVNSGAVS